MSLKKEGFPEMVFRAGKLKSNFRNGVKMVCYITN